MNTKGQAIVLIHGAGSNHSIWNPYLPGLRGDHIILVDLPGHGNSQHVLYKSISNCLSEVIALLERNDIPRCIVVGQSLGAIIGAEMCRQRPELVSRLVMIGPVALGIVKKQGFWKALAVLTKTISGKPSSPKPFQDYSLMHKAAIWKYPFIDLKGTYLNTYSSVISDLLDYKIYWEGIRCPVTVLIGTNDVLVSHKALANAARRTKNIKLITVPCHHLVVTHAKEHLLEELGGLL